MSMISRVAPIHQRTTVKFNAEMASASNTCQSLRRQYRPARLAIESLAIERLAANREMVAPQGNLTTGYQVTKRVLDIAGALFLLVLLGPVMITTFFVLMITMRGRPLFSQERAGHLGKRFRIWKFRTMRLDADKIKHTVENKSDGPVFKNRVDPRITRIGRWLRKTSIDETPQLFQVLAGSMALVGPRPLVLPEVEKFEPWQRNRLSIKPGLTCLWQISGRSDVSFDDWVRMDLWYARNQTLATDARLLIQTPWVVIVGKGAY